MIRYSFVKVQVQKILSLPKGTSGRSISRILSSGSLRLCDHLSMQSTRDLNGAGRSLSLLDLAPGEGCLAARITANAGGLLHHLFTMTHHPFG